MVPVLERRGVPLDPCSEKQARLPLRRGRAVVVGHAPFVIGLRGTVGKSVVHPLTCKVDPGSATDGVGATDNGYGRKETPVGHSTAQKSCFGFTTGDIVRADIPRGKDKGAHVGRVAVRSSRGFKVTTAGGTVDGVSHRYCRLIERGNGWSFITQRRPVLLLALTDGASAPEDKW